MTGYPAKLYLGQKQLECYLMDEPLSNDVYCHSLKLQRKAIKMKKLISIHFLVIIFTSTPVFDKNRHVCI